MPTVLAIDDKTDNLVSVSALLKTTIPAAVVKTARSGQEGITQAKATLPDVILLDVVMPEMDGYEVCQRLRADSTTQHIPIILLTAVNTGTQNRIKGLQAGADAFLTKPIDEGELLAQINVMLRIRKAENLLKEKVQDRTIELEKTNRKLQAELRRRKETEEKRQKAEGALEKQELLYRAMTDNNPDYIMRYDRQYHHIFANKATLRVSGFNAEAYLGKTHRELGFPLHLCDLWEKTLEKVFDKKHEHTEIFQWQSPEGPVIHEWRCVPEFSTEGSVETILGISRDITERKQIEEALKTQQYYLEKAQEIGRIGTWELDVRQNILRWTDENYRVFGVPIGTELTYEVFLNCVHPDDRDYVHEKWTAALHHEPYDIEHRLVVDGNIKWVREKAEVAFDEKGNAVKGIGFTQDITERKHLEREQERTLHDTRERVKELTCMYGVTKSIHKCKTIEETLQDVVMLLPPGWLYPEMTRGKIRFEGTEFVSEPFTDTQWKQISDIVVHDKVCGSVEVYYLEPYPELDEGPFMKEERHLIDGIARTLGEAIERRQAESELSESREHLRMAIDAARVVVWEWDVQADKTTWSDNPEAIFCFPPGAFGNDFESYMKWVHADDRAPINERVAQALQGGSDTYQSEYRIVLPNGDIRWVTAPGKVFRDPAGQPIRIAGTMMDITKKKKQELRLLEQNEFLRTVVESLDDPFYVIDVKDYTVRHANSAARAVGMKEGLPCYKTTHRQSVPCNGQESQCPVKTIAKTKEPMVVEHTHFDEQGQKRSVAINAHPILGKDGDVVQIIAYAVDITDRKQAEIELRESEEKFRSTFEDSSIAMVIGDKNGQFVKINRATSEMFGYSQEELLAMKTRDLTYPGDADEKSDVIQKLWSGLSKGFSTEKRYIHKDGRTVWGNVTVSPVLDSEARVQYLVGQTQDITDRKQAEENLQKELTLRNTLLDNIPSCIAMILKKGTREIVASNNAAREIGAVPGMTCFGTSAQRDDPCPFCLAPETWSSNEPRRAEVEYRGVHYDAIWMPLNEDLYVHYVFNITDRKEAEKQILENQGQLKSLASELILAEERERGRLAVHLHDEVCQNLAFSKMKLQMVKAKGGEQTQLDDMTDVIDNLSQTMKDVRSLTFELSSPILTEFGLVAAVPRWLKEQVEEKHGITTVFTDDGQSKPLGEDVQALLFRSIRELMANIVKHSQAKQVAIAISRTEDEIQIQVEDDGVGFAPDKVVIGKGSGGFGLFSIRERLSHMGGSLEIDSSPGQGCRSLLRAPLEQS
jgi:PAS domain S-box-containing protein